jgi:predicted cupin superfamily sugar epimerase
MSNRAAELTQKLGLAPHPEGGLYREVYRSESWIHPADGRGPRPAITAIYFLLPAGAVSRWHRVQSDELWHFYEGAPLELWVATPPGDRVERHSLGACRDGQEPMLTVRAGWWQAAQSTGPYTLAGCTVGPGFDFSDFVLAADIPSAAAVFRSHDPALAEFL